MVVGLGVEVGELGVHNKTKQLHDDLFPKKEVEKKSLMIYNRLLRSSQ